MSLPRFPRLFGVVMLPLLLSACELLEEESDDTSPTGPGSSGSGSLSLGSSVSNLSGSEGLARRFSFSASGPVTVASTGGSGDADLYVRNGTPPTLSEYDCSSEGGSTEESCTIDANGTVHVMLYGYSSYSGVRLSASSGGGSGGGGGGGGLNLRCPGSLPAGYQCLSAGSQQAPAQYNLPTLHGTWVESSFEVCMTLNSNGTSGFRYRSGFPPESGRWGALVNAAGQRQPNNTTYTVATGSGDPQIAVLTWSGSSFAGFGFQRRSCPW
jgi:hypothetical protein